MLSSPDPLLIAVKSQGWKQGWSFFASDTMFFAPCPAKFDLEPLLILLVRSYFLGGKGAFDTDC